MTNPTRMTKQRKIILEELRMMTTHPSADEIYDRVRHRLPKVSLGTVYRNLELLSKTGEIRKIYMSNEGMRFDPNTHYHHHIQCLKCNCVHDIMATVSEQINSAAHNESGFEIVGHSLNFQGICPNCQESKN